MGRFILRRLLISIPVLLGITFGIFALTHLSPGDPVSALIDPAQAAEMGEEWMEQRRQALGVDQPFIVQYGRWLGELARGNLGYSLADRRPIGPRIQGRVWPTLKLIGSAMILSIVIAVPMGVLSAVRQYSSIDYATTVFAFLAVSIPNFFLALAGIFIFAVILGWLPTGGMSTIGEPATLLDSLRHLILPAFVLGLSQAAPLIRYVRSSMLEVLRQDYVQVARAKGLKERVVLYRHALRNSMIPVVTVLALQLPILLGGTIIVEQVFSWPGMGRLAIEAVRSHDYPLIMAINLIVAVAILVCNLVADVLYAVLDPRIKYS